MLIDGEMKKEYHQVQFDNEKEIEDLVVRPENVGRLFGASAVALPKTKIETTGGIGTIPDGYVIDVERDRWFIVEAETASHSVWGHIAPQVAKQIVAANNLATKQILEDAFCRERGGEIKKALEDNGRTSDENALRISVRGILHSPPIVAIPIDGEVDDLTDFAAVLKPRVMIWRVRKWVASGDDGTRDVLYEVPLEDERDFDSTETPQDAERRKTGSRVTVRDLVNAQLLKEGDQLSKKYKGRSFIAKVTKDGNLTVDGQVFSNPSGAAVHCIQSTGSLRPTEQGWTWWSTGDEETLADLRDEYVAQIRKWLASGEDGTKQVLYEVPLENERDFDSTETTQDAERRKAGSRVTVRDLVNAQLLKEGDELSKTYKGSTFIAKVTKDGNLTVDGQVFFNPSAAAVHCIKSTGSQRPTEQGWTWWSTRDEKTLADLRDEYFAQTATRS
jgi:hemin uptake protein HemP